MTLNGVMAVILRYFSEFGSFRGALRKSERLLSHLLMSSCSGTFRGTLPLKLRKPPNFRSPYDGVLGVLTLDSCPDVECFHTTSEDTYTAKSLRLLGTSSPIPQLPGALSLDPTGGTALKPPAYFQNACYFPSKPRVFG